MADLQQERWELGTVKVRVKREVVDIFLVGLERGRVVEGCCVDCWT